MKLLEIGAPADICPACIQLKTLIKRLIRKKKIEVEGFDYIDATKETDKAMDIAFKHGAWLYNPEEPDKPNWFTPQLFAVVDGNIYLIWAKPVAVLEFEEEVIINRVKQVQQADAKKIEELSKKWLVEDLCDPDTETVVFNEGTILPVLRPDLCKDVLAKLNEEKFKKQALVVAKMFKLDLKI